jgi:chromosome segregation ATPase
LPTPDFFVLCESQRPEDELQSLFKLLQDARRQHEDDLSQARQKFQDELNDARRKSEEDLDRVRHVKDEEMKAVDRQRLEELRECAAEQEAEMSALRAQWEDQMQELRRQTTQLNDVSKNERMKVTEELAQANQRNQDSEFLIARQQEELVLLRGTVRRKEEDEERHLLKGQELRDVISDKEEAHQALAEQNFALVQEIRAKDDEIAVLQSNIEERVRESKDVRTLVQEHDVIVERFRAQVLELQTEKTLLRLDGDQMKAEVNKVREELRLQAVNLQLMANALEGETKLFDKALADQKEEFRDLEYRFDAHQRQAEIDRNNQLEESERYKCAMESQRLETEQIRIELFQIEQLCREQTAQAAQTRAELEECRVQLEQARAAAQTAESLEWDIAKQQEELVMLRGATRRKDEEKLRLELEISSLKEVEILSLKEAGADLEEQLRGSQEAVAVLEEQLRGTQKGLDKLSDEWQKAKAAKAQQAAAAESAIAQLVNKTHEIERLQAQIRDMSDQVDQQICDMSHRVDEIERLQAQICEMSHQIEAAKAQQAAAAESAIAQLFNKTHEIERLQAQIRDMSHQVDEIESLQAQIREMSHQIEAAKAQQAAAAESAIAQVFNKTHEIECLQAQIRDMSHQVEHSISELDRTRTDLEQRDDEHRSYLETIAAKDQELSLKEDWIKTVEGRMEDMSALLVRAEEQLQSSQRAEAELREKMTALESTVAEKQSEADSVLWESKGQQEEICKLRALVRRGKDENELLKRDLESQISELQSSLGNAHRELRSREADLHATSEVRSREADLNATSEQARDQAETLIQELKMRHEEEIAHLRQQAEGIKELNRVSEGRIHEMKEECSAKLSDMRAKLDYEVENKTLALKLQLVERNADLETARKLLNDMAGSVRGSVEELEATLQQVKLEAQEKEQNSEVVFQKALREAKQQIEVLDSSARTLQEEVENKNKEIARLQIDLDELQKAIKVKQQEIEEAKADREQVRTEWETLYERERKEWESERNLAEVMRGETKEKEAILEKFTDLIEDMRGELETARSEIMRTEQDRMRAQEDNVIIRGSLRRKEEERQKLESENIKLLEVIGRKDQDLANLDGLKQRMLSEHKVEVNAKQEILERLKGEHAALEKQAAAGKEAYEREKGETLRKHDLDLKEILRQHDSEKRELLRECEQRNLEIAQKAKDNSDLLVQITNLKDEWRQANKGAEEWERQMDLKDQELIDFKGKHVAIVESLQIDLRKNQLELDRIVQQISELDEYKEEVALLREAEMNRVKELKEWESVHQKNLQAVASLRNELAAAQENVMALEGHNILLCSRVEDLSKDLERDRAELDLQRGENRRREEISKDVMEAGQVVEELKNQVKKLTADAEKKQKAMKEVQSMMRGKAQHEKQGPPAT